MRLNAVLKLSTKTGVSAKEWVKQLAPRCIPKHAFSAHFDRSSGPGGQNVNKVNSKCTLTLENFSTCIWIPQEVRTQLLSKGFRYYAPAKDSVVVQADESRSRETNRQLCLDKFIKEVKQTCWFATPTSPEDLQKWQEIRKKTGELRLKNKKRKSETKKLRKKSNFDF